MGASSHLLLRVILVGSFLLTLTGTSLVYALGDTLFTQQAKLTASDRATQDLFGTSVALSGNTALIGAPGNDDIGSSAGVVYAVTQDAQGQWSEVQKLTASDGVTGGLFGTSVALSGDIALIGAHGHSSQGNFAGAAYVFVRDAAGQWHEAQKLTASDGTAGTLFGWSVALSGNRALIGARSNEDNGGFPGATMTVAGNMKLTSGNEATLGKNVRVSVTEDLHMEAGKCTVQSSAAVTAGTTSGNCL